ncbi:MAG: acetyl-CoA acetyltransferase [Desulfococcus sp. 4484_241]|nr:MAG: acetyl-CoA acetyltransferase [Desulfococcus sp. 4484_241]
MKEAVIVSAVRTPLGAFGGSLSTMGATELGAVVIAEAVRRAGIDPAVVSEVIMGMVLPCGYGQNPARQASVKAGLPWEVECLTVNKVLAGGMENMSMAPYYLERARFGYRMGPGTLQDHMLHDGLWDVVNDFHMGMSNELCCEKYGVSREDQDRYAELSYMRALNSIRSGLFEKEIVPVTLPRGGRNGNDRFSVDECPRETSYETLAKMKPAFKDGGVGTAGNSSVISDGAAAVVVMSREKAEALGCRVIAGIGAQAAYGIDMKYVLMAPVWAIPKCLDREGIGIGDVDLFEINEAFSGSTVAVMRELGIDTEKVNVNGGSVALGHPIGASGCRVLVTLVHEMERRDVQTGLASLCLGGGEAVAMVVKRD